MSRVTIGMITLFVARAATAQLNADQAACVNALNRDGAKVAQQQGKETLACVKSAGKGKLTGPAQACLTADAKMKVANAKAKATADELQHCADTPGFGYATAGTVNAVAQQGELDIAADLFGTNLDAAVASCSTDAKRCKCQANVLNAVEKLGKTKRQLFVKCKKAALATATSTADIAKCVTDAGTAGSIAAETASGGKVDKAITKLGGVITKICDTHMVTIGSFPGGCDALTGSSLRDCLDHVVECRTCETLNHMDGLALDCDLFDDGLSNGSCANTLYHGWTSPLAGCLTNSYDTTEATSDGGTYPFNLADSNACKAWKLAATICNDQPEPYYGTDNWSCSSSGGFTDPNFGTYCPSQGTQFSCSTCPAACNAQCQYNPLSLRACNGQESTQPPSPNGSNCYNDPSCVSGLCLNGTCRPSHCSNGALDDGETAVDCGGDCSPCQSGQACNIGSDCTTGQCNSNVCGVSDGGACVSNADCAHNLCEANACRPVSCADGIQNNNETAVDCGGDCAPCQSGQACNIGSDCTTGQCTSNVCGVPDGGACVRSADCAHNLCEANACRPVSCADGIQNNNELAVDCGGGTCAGCGAGTPCSSGADCLSGVCDGSNTCTLPALYHGWASPIAGCLTDNYDTTAPTVDGGTYPFNLADSNACKAWKLAATICNDQPQPYDGTDNWSCNSSGGFTDPAFGTYCPSQGMQFSCSTCPGACNAQCIYNPLSLRACNGQESNQP